jgi:hypothetical protein
VGHEFALSSGRPALLQTLTVLLLLGIASRRVPYDPRGWQWVSRLREPRRTSVLAQDGNGERDDHSDHDRTCT